MFAVVKSVNFILLMSEGLMSIMNEMMENAGLICDTQTFLRSQICFY